jgi:hypothetical protein
MFRERLAHKPGKTSMRFMFMIINLEYCEDCYNFRFHVVGVCV